jgi:hypothetical protein
MVVVPITIPCTTPEEEPTVATEVVELTHVPPPVMLPSVIVLPAPVHTVADPVIGAPATVTILVAAVPQPVLYVIVAVPAVTPVTTPVDPIVATLASLLLQVPFATVLASVIEDPAQTVDAPVIAAGVTNTVTTWVARHPVEVKVKVIVAVPAAAPLVTTPLEDPTDAIAALLLLQVPAPPVADRLVVELAHTVNVPVTEGLLIVSSAVPGSTEVHPLLSVTVTLYVPPSAALARVRVVLCPVDEKLFGPVHE